MILVVYGTRPEYIKVKPLIDELKLEKIPFKTLFTGQHKDIAPENADYNFSMVELSENRLDSILKNCLSIPHEYFSGITHVLVQGDTTSALGLAITAFHKKIKIIHLEAGLRTYDFENPYPEEMNRQLISRIASINLCPTTKNYANLEHENINGSSYVVGNTVLDNLLEYKNEITYEDVVLITLHRRENHDKIERWFKSINDLSLKYPKLKFILPIHPNPNVIKHKGLLANIEVVDPLSHSELLKILVKCKLVITDSGGIQEESSFFNKKTLVCRETTERTESVGLTSFLVDSPENLGLLFDMHISNYEVRCECPYGDGTASKKIIKIIKNENI